MDSKDAYIIQLENTIKSLERQVNNLTKMVILLRKQKFGSSSEKTPKYDDGVQLNLFNEAELEASEEAPEPVVRRVGGYYRIDSKTKREELLKDLPVEEIECVISLDERICPKCKTKLVPLAEKSSVKNWNIYRHNFTFPITFLL